MPLPLSHSQRERLAYLELRAYFVGELRRGDLEARFSIKPAAATRDLNAYREQAPDNLIYDRYVKAYVPTARFRPVFGFSADRVLSWLLNGFGDGQALKISRTIPCEGAGNLVQPDFAVLAELTRAIHAGQAMKIEYLSLSSGVAKRVIVPVALADNGSRWHVRAYDRKRSHFSDFVLTRITKARTLSERGADHEQIRADTEWNRIVDLQLVPHPGLSHPEAVVADYGMKDGQLHLQVRAALAGYAVLRWGVDCSVDHRLDPSRHHLWLANPQTLNGVESAALAPGHGAAGDGGAGR
ncbi:WYL domain-containing protein [Aromatoleum anaerobium]|uniref:WYL domain-containing protein n=1 Tax=Aromatoleum anaerobium TaxID=182180 RepID=A0ABX1PHN8_9RHOO|nr:WYL domain-containing protein [Aromatoleum anaerobium]MCK0506225.1 WYL domain-containing protein [Aromatoleum anaerobium]